MEKFKEFVHVYYCESIVKNEETIVGNCGASVLPYMSLHGPVRYVRPQRVGFLSRFGYKKGIDLAHFGLKWSMVFPL